MNVKTDGIAPTLAVTCKTFAKLVLFFNKSQFFPVFYTHRPVLRQFMLSVNTILAQHIIIHEHYYS
jgi:hypothetical protein